ncbi:glucose-6-phosphate isomerase [Candidatus Saccharibacteria bacterium]|nr:glucose-6-phosphate isomerase [Candidatus Saccharibacteria bacterium]
MIELQSYNVTLNLNLDPARQLLPEIANDQMAGWYNLPFADADLSHIQAAVKKIQSDSDYLVCVGIGGSYLGHRAIIEALKPKSPTKILYAGNSLSPFALQEVLDELGDADFSINVISKSGTTTEPAIAFRILKQKLIKKYGESEAYRRIYATTDAQHGALHDEAVTNHYQMFTVPDNVGGRYSVLTDVGLLPLAVAGVDVKELLAGAEQQSKNPEPALAYATLRATLAENNYDTEILATFEPRLAYFNEWWKQLFGESEGKDQKGIFPASVVYTTDLHSLGQYLQDGRRNIFETVLDFTEPELPALTIPSTPDNLDNLNYLAGESLAYVNHQALMATIKAHSISIPVVQIKLPNISAKTLGALIYFFELACTVSAKLQGVNPFDQPGVEAYKQEMFKLLGRP